MPKVERSALCVYGHFSQPARGNPLTELIGTEPDAAPYRNWNERITTHSYRPNAEINNFAHISYSFGEALLEWLKRQAADVYQKVVDADKAAAAANSGAGHALATAYHHSILPLARKRDKRTQILWGLAAFEHHYGRKPHGFWLPEMAVDSETLTLLAENHIQYTILAQKQLTGTAPSGSGPYRINLPGGQQIGVFVRNDSLSSEISFNIHNLGGAGRWSHQVLAPARKAVGPLLLLATAGETFGHHFAGEEQFLYWLVTHEAERAGYRVVTLDEVFVSTPPEQAVTIEERSSWSDQRGLTRWSTGQHDRYEDTTWKGALRRALDNAASDIDRVYEDLLRPYKIDPWALRDRYAPVALKDQEPEAFVSEHAPALESDQRGQLIALLQAQELVLRMFNSYTFTNNSLDSAHPRYAIACAAAALMIAQQASEHDVTERLLPDLAVVTSTSTTKTGADLLHEVVQQYGLKIALS